MAQLGIQNSYSILLTPRSIEIYPGKVKKENAVLICFCQHYQAALRIAQRAAQLHRHPLVVFINPSEYSPLPQPSQFPQIPVGSLS